MAIILTFFVGNYGLGRDRDYDEKYSEQLLDQAKKAIEQSKKLRKEIAKEKPPPDRNYRIISSENENSWEKEMGQIIDD